jgi:hypothetical protein
MSTGWFQAGVKPQRNNDDSKEQRQPRNDNNNRRNNNKNYNNNRSNPKTKNINAQVNSTQQSKSLNSQNPNSQNRNRDIPPPNSQSAVAKLFANMRGPTANPTSIKEVSITDAYIHKNMTRSYELTRPPPEGFQIVLKKMFPSLDVCIINNVEIKNKILPSLFLHFNENHEKGNQDYEKSSHLQFTVQGIVLRLIAVGADKVDAEGTLIPKINKKIYATGVPFSLTRNSTYLKEILSKWVELDDSDPIKMVYEDGMYKGSLVIPVLEYNKVPPTIVNFPFFTLNAYGSYEKVPNAVCKVSFLSKGHDPNMRPEMNA